MGLGLQTGNKHLQRPWTSQMGLVKATLQLRTAFTCQSASSEHRHKGHVTAVLDQFFVAPLDFMNKFFPTSGF